LNVLNCYFQGVLNSYKFLKNIKKVFTEDRLIFSGNLSYDRGEKYMIDKREYGQGEKYGKATE